MYMTHFGLREDPFGITPDTNFFIPTNAYQKAFNTLSIAVKSGAGFVKITGEVGTGKTLLCRNFLENLGPEYITAYIHNPYLEPNTLLLALADELKVPLADFKDNDQHQLLKLLTKGLSDITEQGRHVVLCIDEAQAMPLQSLEALRLLTNLETEKQKLLRVILFGQPELDEKLHKESVRQLLQRIIFQHQLMPLARDEIGHYLSHRLNVAGYQGGVLFLPDAVRALYRATLGIPRLINILAHKSLLLACTEGRRQVGKRIVLAAVIDTPAAKQPFLHSWATVISLSINHITLIAGGLLSILLIMLGVEWGWPLLPWIVLRTPAISITHSTKDQKDQPVVTASSVPRSLTEPTIIPAVTSAPPMQNVPVSIVSDPELPLSVPPPLSNISTIPVTSAQASSRVEIDPSKKNVDGGQKDPLKEKVAPTVASPKNFNELIDRTDWIHDQNQNYYTLIILNARRRLQTLQQFARDHENFPELRYFRLQRHGRELFVMIHGLYPNKLKARQAAKNIAEKWRDVKPRLRRIKQIQTQMNQDVDPARHLLLLNDNPNKNKPRHELTVTNKTTLLNQGTTSSIVPNQFNKSIDPARRAKEQYESALSLLRKGEINQAREGLKQTLVIDPSYHNARLALANLALERNDQSAAEKILQAGLQLDPQAANLAFPLARIIIEHGNPQDALTILRGAQSHAGENPDYHAFTGALEQRISNHQAAIDEYRQALRYHPNNATWLMGLGISLTAEQRHAEAIQVFRLALKNSTLSNESRAYIKQQLQLLEINNQPP
ncbi:MSHA biogenesis protein MshM [Gammaproteobacteria bacterium]